MLFEYINLLIGMIKILLYKIIYFNRIHFKSVPKMNNTFHIAIKKESKLSIGTKFRSRYNVSFRIYNGGKVKIGDNCFFNDGCSINCQDEIEIGNNVICGQNVLIFDHDHDYKNDMTKFVKRKVKIGNNVWIGANVTILKGVTIGDNAVIAAGTIVKEDILDGVLTYQEINMKNKKIGEKEGM